MRVTKTINGQAKHVLLDPDYGKGDQPTKPENILWWAAPLWIFIGVVTIFNSYFYMQYRTVDADWAVFWAIVIEIAILALFIIWYNKTKIKPGKGAQGILWVAFILVAATVQGFTIYTALSTVTNVPRYASIADFDPNSGVEYISIDKFDFFEAPLYSCYVDIERDLFIEGETYVRHDAFGQWRYRKDYSVDMDSDGRPTYEKRYFVPMGVDSTVMCWYSHYVYPLGVDGVYGKHAHIVKQDILAFHVSKMDVIDTVAYDKDQYGYDSIKLIPVIEPVLGNLTLEPMFEEPPKTSFWMMITSGVFMLSILIIKWIAQGFRYASKCITISQEQYNEMQRQQEQMYPDEEDAAN